VTIIQERWEFFGNIPVGGKFRRSKRTMGYFTKTEEVECPTSGALHNSVHSEAPLCICVNDADAVLYMKEVSP
jgi:hypothetical protein